MNDKRSGNTRKGLLLMAQGAAIAALYVILTFVSQALGLMSFDVQIRFSEALCIMPFFTAAAVPGLTLGCVLANLLTGGAPANSAASTAAGTVGYTDLLITWLFKIATGAEAQYYMASVIGIMVFAVVAVISLIVYNLLPSIKNEEDFQ